MSNDTKEFLKNKSSLWKQAAVYGALWGAIEITVGSFLHSTRIPITGIVLASAGVTLLTGIQILTGKSWMPLRIALICAAIRTLSPEGLMLGPMFAIIFQGFVVSAAWIMFHNSSLTGIIAGAISSIASQVQGFVVRLFAYGAKLWDLYLLLMEKGEKLFHLKEGHGWIVVIFYLLIVACIGMLGGYAGYKIGQYALTMKQEREASRTV